jgi:hypothetical protein
MYEQVGNILKLVSVMERIFISWISKAQCLSAREEIFPSGEQSNILCQQRNHPSHRLTRQKKKLPQLSEMSNFELVLYLPRDFPPPFPPPAFATTRIKSA